MVFLGCHGRQATEPAVIRQDRGFPVSYVGTEDRRSFTGFVENAGAAFIGDFNHAVEQYEAKGSFDRTEPEVRSPDTDGRHRSYRAAL